MLRTNCSASLRVQDKWTKSAVSSSRRLNRKCVCGGGSPRKEGNELSIPTWRPVVTSVLERKKLRLTPLPSARRHRYLGYRAHFLFHFSVGGRGGRVGRALHTRALRLKGGRKDKPGG